MFRPIKNFINYLQKNAGSGLIFGGTGTTAVEGTVGAEGENILEGKDIETDNQQDERKEREKVGVVRRVPAECYLTKATSNGSIMDKCYTHEKAETTLAPCMESISVAHHCDEENIDVETQIRSSVMLKRSTTGSQAVTALAGQEGVVAQIFVPKSHHNGAQSRDFNQNHAILNELDVPEFRHHSIHQIDDFCSVGSGEPVEEFPTEDEDEDDTEGLLDMNHEITQFSESEIIVVGEVDLNSSTNSDTPAEDPLAIDDFTHLTSRGSINSLDSSTLDEASNSDVTWIDIEESQIPKRNDDTSADTDSASSTPQRRSPKDSECSAGCSKKPILIETAEEIRSDGSDSGLGSETSALRTVVNANQESHTDSTKAEVHDKTSQRTDESLEGAVCIAEVTGGLALSAPKKPLRSNLKRRFEVESESLEAASAAVCATPVAASGSLEKKLKRSINFDAVHVYYFPRQQGFGCVPSAGGCTLGMGAQHIAYKTLTLAEHAAELRRAHRMQLQEINPRTSSSDDTEESEEDYLSDGSGSDLDTESSGFLQPVSPKQRRALLKAAGIRKIDASEKAECRDIRNSREVCGCTCRDFCDPDTCSCSQAGIKCQVDRAMFPCGCSRDACSNSMGRVEFNPARVRTHFIHTIMRLEMENRQQQNPPLCSSSNLAYGLSVTTDMVASSPSTQAVISHGLPGNFYSLQPHSNYSSGYASPAYPNEQAANFYQPQNSHYSGLLNQELHPARQYPSDSLDSSLFSTAATPAPPYGALLPSYGNANVANTTTAYHNYGSISSDITPQIPPYTSYAHQQAAANYLPSIASVSPAPNITYRSCSVPSVPPYGAATTTDATPDYHENNNISLEITGSLSCSTIAVDHIASSFTSPNPISSSPRLSEINDLLQHSRTGSDIGVAIPLSCTITATSKSSTIENAIGNNTIMNSVNAPSIQGTPTDGTELDQRPPPPRPPPPPPPPPVPLPPPPTAPPPAAADSSASTDVEAPTVVSEPIPTHEILMGDSEFVDLPAKRSSIVIQGSISHDHGTMVSGETATCND